MLARSQNSVKASHRECGLMMEELCASRHEGPQYLLIY
jgi:hypothetical protein